MNSTRPLCKSLPYLQQQWRRNTLSKLNQVKLIVFKHNTASLATQPNYDENNGSNNKRRLTQVPYNEFVNKFGISVDKAASLQSQSVQNTEDEHDHDMIDDNPHTLKNFQDENLDLGGVSMDAETLVKFVSKGGNSSHQVSSAIESENAEWGDTHWSERHYPASQNEMVIRERPHEIQQMINEGVPAIHQSGKLSIMPVQAGGPAYPIFYNPNTGIDRPQANIPQSGESRKSRVLHIQSLHKQTNLNYSECSMAYDYAGSQYTVALETLRGRQVNMLSELTGKNKNECKQVFDQCLGDYQRALRKLELM